MLTIHPALFAHRLDRIETQLKCTKTFKILTTSPWLRERQTSHQYLFHALFFSPCQRLMSWCLCCPATDYGLGMEKMEKIKPDNEGPDPTERMNNI